MYERVNQEVVRLEGVGRAGGVRNERAGDGGERNEASGMEALIVRSGKDVEVVNRIGLVGAGMIYLGVREGMADGWTWGKDRWRVSGESVGKYNGIKGESREQDNRQLWTNGARKVGRGFGSDIDERNSLVQ